jgi:hypothetical protein
LTTAIGIEGRTGDFGKGRRKRILFVVGPVIQKRRARKTGIRLLHRFYLTLRAHLNVFPYRGSESLEALP